MQKWLESLSERTKDRWTMIIIKSSDAWKHEEIESYLIQFRIGHGQVSRIFTFWVRLLDQTIYTTDVRRKRLLLCTFDEILVYLKDTCLLYTSRCV